MRPPTLPLAIVLAVLIEVLRKNEINVKVGPEMHDVVEEPKVEAVSLADREFKEDGWHQDCRVSMKLVVTVTSTKYWAGLVSELAENDELART